MLFGEFLVSRGVVTEDQILKALDHQRKGRFPIGTVAIMEKFLNIKDVYSILNKQVEKPGKMFGQIAIELGFITEEELQTILELQKETNPHIGEVLVEQGVIDKEQLYEELNVYVRFKDAALASKISR